LKTTNKRTTTTQIIRSIGVDEVTALLLDHSGNITAVGNGTTYMCALPVVALQNMTCHPSAPLSISNVQCERLQGAGFVEYDDPNADTFNTESWTGSGVQYSFDVVNGEIIGEPYGP
jgi:cyanophycinase-like exopeptidase